MTLNCVESLDLINKKFPMALEINAGKGIALNYMKKHQNGIETFTMMDEMEDFMISPLSADNISSIGNLDSF